MPKTRTIPYLRSLRIKEIGRGMPPNVFPISVKIRYIRRSDKDATYKIPIDEERDKHLPIKMAKSPWHIPSQIYYFFNPIERGSEKKIVEFKDFTDAIEKAGNLILVDDPQFYLRLYFEDFKLVEIPKDYITDPDAKELKDRFDTDLWKDAVRCVIGHFERFDKVEPEFRQILGDGLSGNCIMPSDLIKVEEITTRPLRYVRRGVKKAYYHTKKGTPKSHPEYAPKLIGPEGIWLWDHIDINKYFPTLFEEGILEYREETIEVSSEKKYLRTSVRRYDYKSISKLMKMNK